MIRKLMLVILTAILFSAQSNAGTRKAVQRGLDWLIQQQHPKGYWGSYNREHHRVAMTSLAGMALLMEGSTLSAGKYLKPLRKAVKWILKCSRREEEVDGLIYADNAWHSDNHYMFGHGYALLFLASAYGEENRPWMRRQIQNEIFRAVKLS